MRDAQLDTIADRRDFDVKHINGWRSLPIVKSKVFARCAVLVRRVRCCAVLCGAVRCCAVLCGRVRFFAFTNWNDEQTNDLCRVGERRR
jgi:hypothetical protein